MDNLEKIDEMVKLFKNLIKNKQTQELINLLSDYGAVNGIVLCGVGKNWYICEKINKTFISMGLKSNTLDPIHALHGDIGLLRNQIIIFISKSGNTIELTNTIKYLNKIKKEGIINCKLVGVFLNPEPTCLSDLDMLISSSKDESIYEFDEKNIIPSLSINILQLYLDYVGVRIFEDSPDLIKRYKYNHPGGSIGKQLSTNSLL